MIRKPIFAVLSILFVAGALTAHAAGARFRFDPDNVPGWVLMTSTERTAHHQKLLSFKTVGECKAYMEVHRKKMDERAKERNRTDTARAAFRRL